MEACAPKLMLPILRAMVSPTASTAPLGLRKLISVRGESTLKSLMPVPAQILAASAAYTHPQTMLRYHPIDKEVHLKVWTFTIAGASAFISRRTCNISRGANIPSLLTSPPEWACLVAVAGRAVGSPALVVWRERRDASSIVVKILCSGMCGRKV